ncbi:hypothetical protein [Winogradskyella sp.]|uniref:hypothetical protein n=1 Tax=Winogradskyella sp. TaxID=1883156 RepID=UPI003AA86EA6
MKLKTVYSIALLFILALFGCKNNKKSTIVLEGLTLNNGKQWVVNQETHIGMKRIDSILKTETSIDTKTLGNVLSKETSYIIKSCNMKGEAHDQLHIVLVPILEEITDLKDEENDTAKAQKIKRLKLLVAKYFEFFKV